MYRVGDMIYFWTGRGSHGYATITRLDTGRGRVLLEPEPDAHKGSDYRTRASGQDYWAPRSLGVLLDQIDTPPQVWFTNF
jgi:hypothetical protein